MVCKFRKKNKTRTVIESKPWLVVINNSNTRNLKGHIRKLQSFQNILPFNKIIALSLLCQKP